jgi:lipid A oxidase
LKLATRAGTRLAIALLALAIPSGVWAEPFLDAYVGKSFTQNNDIHIRQPRVGSDFTFENVTFDDDSFESPIYYGLRAGYFIERYPWLGFGAEFFHFKIVADTSTVRPIRGTVAGSSAAGTVPVNSVVQQFEVSHGVNYLTLDALVRYPLLTDPERFPVGRLQLYAGVGLGPVIGHPETRIDNIRSRPGYELAGLGVQGFAGLRFLIFKYLGVFAEYKFTHSGLSVSVPSGTGTVTENTNHLVGGLTIHFK